MKKSTSLFLLLCSTALLLVGCSENETQKQPDTYQPDLNVSPGRHPAPQEKSPVVAQSATETVTLAQVTAYFRLYGDSFLTKQGLSSDGEGVRNAVRDILAERFLANEAVRKGILDQEPPALDLKWQNMRMTAYVTKRAVEASVPKPSEQEIKREFERLKDQLSVPPVYQDRHIFKKVPPWTEEKQLGAIQKQMEEIRTEIENGLDFVDAARKYSDAANAEKGGLNREWTPGTFNKEFESLITKLEPGQMGPVERSRAGFFIIRLENLTPAQSPTFDNCKAQILKDMWKSRKAEAIRQKISALAAQLTVQVHKDRIYSETTPSDTVVARAGTHTITYREIPYALRFSPTPPFSQEEIRTIERQMDVWVELALLSEYGKQQGYSEVEPGRSEIEIKKNRLLTEYCLDWEAFNYAPEHTREQLLDFYENNKEEFRPGRKIKARELAVFADIDDCTDRVKSHYDVQKARELATEIVRRVRAGEDFATLAKEHSTLSNADKGGEVEWTVDGVPRSPYYDVNAYKLVPGEISDPYMMRTGAYVVTVEKEEVYEVPAFEQVREEVEKRLLTKRQGEKWRQLVDEAFAATHPEFNEENIDKALEIIRE